MAWLAVLKIDAAANDAIEFVGFSMSLAYRWLL
jgi:hypothetical protein